jgi:hypothetical protein
MKRFALVSLSAIALTLTSTLPTIASAPLVDSRSEMSFSFNAPFISSSGLRGDHHLIRVMVLGMALQDVMVMVPSKMAKFRNISVTDESGKPIPAKIDRSDRRVSVVFNQPVTPGKTITLDFSDADVSMEEGEILLYGVTAKQVGLEPEIPIGTARIQIPARN